MGHLFDAHFPRDSEPTPLALFWAQHLVWWFPWVLFAVAAAVNRPTHAVGVGTRQAHPLARLPVAWFLTAAFAASLSGQRQDYHTMFAWPAFALLLSGAWERAEDRRELQPAIALPLILLAGLGALGLAVYGLSETAPPSAGGTSAPFGERNSALGVIAGIAGAEWRTLRPFLLPAAGGLLLGAIGGLALAWRSETRRWSWLPVAAALGREGERAGIVVYDGASHRASSLCFYTDVPVRGLEFAERSSQCGRAESAAIDLSRRRRSSPDGARAIGSGSSPRRAGSITDGCTSAVIPARSLPGAARGSFWPIEPPDLTTRRQTD